MCLCYVYIILGWTDFTVVKQTIIETMCKKGITDHYEIGWLYSGIKRKLNGKKKCGSINVHT